MERDAADAWCLFVDRNISLCTPPPPATTTLTRCYHTYCATCLPRYYYYCRLLAWRHRLERDPLRIPVAFFTMLTRAIPLPSLYSLSSAGSSAGGATPAPSHLYVALKVIPAPMKNAGRRRWRRRTARTLAARCLPRCAARTTCRYAEHRRTRGIRATTHRATPPRPSTHRAACAAAPPPHRWQRASRYASSILPAVHCATPLPPLPSLPVSLSLPFHPHVLQLRTAGGVTSVGRILRHSPPTRDILEHC